MIKVRILDAETVKVGTSDGGSGENSGNSGVGATFKVDETLRFENGVLGVNTAKEVQKNNTLPITAAAVYSTVGNIEVLLGTI